MKFKNILFDLDGTLANSYEGVTNSVKYALEKMGIEVKNRDLLRVFIGPPLIHTFREKYGMSQQEGERAVDLYREYYTPKGVYENALYPGTETLLKYIEENGGESYVVTSKPQGFAETVVKSLNIDKYFKFIQGVSFDSCEVTKDILIKSVMEKFGMDKNDTVMIGDTRFDIVSANKVGITSIGVLHGFGGMRELTESRADIIVKDFSELKNIL